jgi:hypothetical protein
MKKYETKIIDNVLYIKCIICNKRLPITDFYKRKNTKIGVDPRCKKCKYNAIKKSINQNRRYQLKKKYKQNKNKILNFNRHTFHIRTYRYVLKN